MIRIYDHIFYRIAKFLYKKDGISATRAVGLMTAMGSMLVSDALLVVRVVFFASEDLSDAKKYVWIVTLLTVLPIGFFNYKHFKNRYWRLSERWRGTEVNGIRLLRGILVVIAIIFPFALFIFIFYLASIGVLWKHLIVVTTVIVVAPACFVFAAVCLLVKGEVQERVESGRKEESEKAKKD